MVSASLELVQQRQQALAPLAVGAGLDRGPQLGDQRVRVLALSHGSIAFLRSPLPTGSPTAGPHRREAPCDDVGSGPVAFNAARCVAACSRHWSPSRSPGSVSASRAHVAVARHLGEDRGGGDRIGARVAADDGLGAAAQLGRHAVAVDQHDVGLLGQRLQRAAHGEEGRLQDVDACRSPRRSPRRRRSARSPRRSSPRRPSRGPRAPASWNCRSAAAACAWRRVRSITATAGDHRAGERPAADLVDAGDAERARGLRVLLRPAIRSGSSAYPPTHRLRLSGMSLIATHHRPGPCGHETASCGPLARPARLVHRRRLRAQSGVGPSARHRAAARRRPISTCSITTPPTSRRRPSRPSRPGSTALEPAPWQVRNQARMHVWKDLPQHRSTADSMIYWLETVTAVGVRLEADDSPHRHRPARHRRPARPALPADRLRPHAARRIRGAHRQQALARAVAEGAVRRLSPSSRAERSVVEGPCLHDKPPILHSALRPSVETTGVYRISPERSSHSGLAASTLPISSKVPRLRFAPLGTTD